MHYGALTLAKISQEKWAERDCTLSYTAGTGIYSSAAKSNVFFLYTIWANMFNHHCLAGHITSWNPWLVSIPRTRRLSVRTILKAKWYRSEQVKQQNILSVQPIVGYCKFLFFILLSKPLSLVLITNVTYLQSSWSCHPLKQQLQEKTREPGWSCWCHSMQCRTGLWRTNDLMRQSCGWKARWGKTVIKCNIVIFCMAILQRVKNYNYPYLITSILNKYWCKLNCYVY